MPITPLEISIKSKAELAGFEAATDAIERQAGAAKAAGKAHDDLSAAVARNRRIAADYRASQPSARSGPAAGEMGDLYSSLGAQAITSDRSRTATDADAAAKAKFAEHVKRLANGVKDFAGAEAAATKAAASHTVPLEKLQRIFAALNDVLPGLGIVMQAAFSPIGAAISIGVTALTLFRTRMEEVNAEFQRLEEEAAKPATHALEANHASARRLSTGLAALHDDLAKAARSQKTVKEETDKASEALRQQKELAQSGADALHSGELASLEMLHKAGVISEQQYADAKLQIEIRLIAQRHRLQEKDLEDQIKLREAGLQRARKAQPGLDKAAEDALAKADDIQRKAETATSVEELSAGYADARAKTAALEKSLGEKKSAAFGRIGVVSTAEFQKAIPEELINVQPGPYQDMLRKEAIAKLTEDYDKWSRSKAGETGAAEALRAGKAADIRRQVDLQSAVSAAATAKDRAVQNQQNSTNEAEAIGDMRTQADQVKAANKTLVRTETQTAAAQRIASMPPEQIQAALNTDAQVIARQGAAYARRGNMLGAQEMQALLGTKEVLLISQVSTAIQQRDRQHEVAFTQMLNIVRNSQAWLARFTTQAKSLTGPNRQP